MGRQMQCPATGKNIFWTERRANQAISKAGKHSINLSHYKCKSCNNWHLATNRKKKREKPDERISD